MQRKSVIGAANVLDSMRYLGQWLCNEAGLTYTFETCE